MADKLWQGRFDQPTDKLVEDFTASIDLDSRLYRYDIEGSIAHCRMLAEAGILTHDEASRIVEALGEIYREIERGLFKFNVAQEDIHMAIEQRLMQKVGDLGGKLHTARSRNDQVALDMRMFVKDVVAQCRSLIIEVQKTLMAMAEEHLDVIMPGFTHLQHAQPVLLAHHLMAYYEMFDRDDGRLADCLKRTNVLPLGSGALAGTTFPIDVHWTADYLNFPRASRNSLDAVSDRDFIIEFNAAAALCMMHVSRLAEELILWSTSEFSYVEISDAFCTGSSMMPQKKNPDVAELMRGKTARVYGNLTALLTLLKALPLSYNRDLQEDKRPLFDTADTLIETLRLLVKLLPEIRFHRDRMAQAAQEGFTLATDLADYLVGKSVPFRKAHYVVGQVVHLCIDQQKPLHECTLNELREFHKAFDEDVYDLLKVSTAVDRRASWGGTASSRVREVIEQARNELKQREKELDL